MLRVLILIGIASAIWTPIGVYVGLRPKLTALVQPVAQFMAAFPANLLFPVAVAVIVTFNLNPDIFLSPLMVLGTQWYILFNVIAGASAMPREMRDVSTSLRRQAAGCGGAKSKNLPGRISLLRHGRDHGLRRFVERKHRDERSVKLGPPNPARALASALISRRRRRRGDFHRIVLGVGVMCFYVVLMNRLFWRPLYRYAERKYRLT